MRGLDKRWDMEIAGALTPELEGASHSAAHGDRLRKQRDRGDRRNEK